MVSTIFAAIMVILSIAMGVFSGVLLAQQTYWKATEDAINSLLEEVVFPLEKENSELRKIIKEKK